MWVGGGGRRRAYLSAYHSVFVDEPEVSDPTSALQSREQPQLTLSSTHPCPERAERTAPGRRGARGEMAAEAFGEWDPSTPGCGESPGMKDSTSHPPSGETDVRWTERKQGGVQCEHLIMISPHVAP